MNMLSPNQQFFHDNLHVFGHAPGESPEMGRAQTAIRLERAENDYLGAHRVADVRFEWDRDANGYIPRTPGCQPEPEWQCSLWHGENCLASLGGIDDGSDTPEDRRVFRAELALEAQSQLRAIALGEVV